MVHYERLTNSKNPPLAMSKVLEGQVLYGVHKLVVTRMHRQLLQHLYQHKTQDELHCQIPTLSNASTVIRAAG